MKYRHSNYPADEMKIRKMIWVHSTVWIDLKRIDIIPEITYSMVMTKKFSSDNKKIGKHCRFLELNYLEY